MPAPGSPAESREGFIDDPAPPSVFALIGAPGMPGQSFPSGSLRMHAPTPLSPKTTAPAFAP